MIKARGGLPDGTPVALFGLSAENMARLMADEPIALNLAEMGLPSMQIIIVGGPTEDAIVEQLRRHVSLRDGARGNA